MKSENETETKPKNNTNKEKLQKSLSLGNLDCEEEDEILPLSQATVAFEPRPDGRKSADIFVSNEKKLGEKKAEHSVETYEKALQKTESKIDAKNSTSETMIIDSKVDFTSYESFNSKHEKSSTLSTSQKTESSISKNI